MVALRFLFPEVVDRDRIDPWLPSFHFPHGSVAPAFGSLFSFSFFTDVPHGSVAPASIGKKTPFGEEGVLAGQLVHSGQF